ncbi:MAG: helix-turn-helix transcriptional regulator [Actinomycetes bacterium]
MAAPRIDRTERLLNLVFALMGSEQPVSRASIAASIPGYDPSAGQAAFERMFERDKDELRSLGIPIRTVLDVNGDVSGYTIERDAYALPDLHFTAAERSVLSLAASAWQNAFVRSSASAGLRKLETDSEIPARDDVSSGFVAYINSADSSLLPLLGLLRERSAVAFDYQAPQADVATERHVDPWGLIAQEGGWYLVGHDRDRGDTRAFRLSRMRSAPRSLGPIEHSAPPGTDLRSLIDPASRAGERVSARIRVAAGAGAGIRRLSNDGLPPDRAGELEVTTADRTALVSAVLFAGDGVEIIEPIDARQEIIDALMRVRDMHAGVGA